MFDKSKYNYLERNIGLLKDVYSTILGISGYRITYGEDFDIRLYDKEKRISNFKEAELEREHVDQLYDEGSRFTWLFHGRDGEKIYLDSYGSFSFDLNNGIKIDVDLSDYRGKRAVVFSIEEHQDKNNEYPKQRTTINIDLTSYDPIRTITTIVSRYNDELSNEELVYANIKQEDDLAHVYSRGEDTLMPVDVNRYFDIVYNEIFSVQHYHPEDFAEAFRHIHYISKSCMRDFKYEKEHELNRRISDVRRLLDEYQSKKEEAIRKVTSDWDTLIGAVDKELGNVKSMYYRYMDLNHVPNYSDDELARVIESVEEEINKLETQEPININDVIRERFSNNPAVKMVDINNSQLERLHLLEELLSHLYDEKDERKGRSY